MKKKKPKINIHAKGKRGEYATRDLIRGFGWEIRRTPMSGAIDGWKGDLTSRDFPFFVEVKNTAKTTFLPWWQKANDQSQTKPPIIAWVNGGEVYCFALLSDILQVIRTGAATKTQFPKAQKKHSIDKSANLMFSKANQIRQKNK